MLNYQTLIQCRITALKGILFREYCPAWDSDPLSTCQVVCQAQLLPLAWGTHLPLLTLRYVAELLVLPNFPCTFWTLWKCCQYLALKYVKCTYWFFSKRSISNLFNPYVSKGIFHFLFKIIPLINTFEDWAVLIFFPFLSLLGTFLTMIFYIMVPSANASPDS